MWIRSIAVGTLGFGILMSMHAQAKKFTIDEALSAPFASDLVASPRMSRFAWVEDEQGKRNLWIAQPDPLGKYQPKRLTSYDQDDGQEMYQISWTPDAENLVYVRGGDLSLIHI